MEDSKQQEARDQALHDELERAGAFEEMVRTKGWEYLKAYYLNQVQQLANDLLLSPEEPIEKLEGRRQRLVGLRQLMAEVDSSLDTLKRYREEKSGK